MNLIHQYIKNIPFFRHLTDSEISELSNIGKIESITKGHKLDFKKLNSFGIVLDGLFGFESRGKSDVVYLMPGSFFGDLPFISSKYHGSMKAFFDSRVVLFKIEDLYRFFVSSYKGLRGYLKTVRKIGFEVTEKGMEHIQSNSKVLTVYSPYNDSGKSVFSSFLGISLSHYGKTIILDTSYKGNSIFNIFEKPIIPAISQRQNDEKKNEQNIYDNILNLNENLSLLNIAFDSKVKVDPAIFPPLLFLLSKDYRHIIMDLSDYDADLRDQILSVSDTIYVMIKRINDRNHVYDLFDMLLKEGQRIFYVINRYYAKDIGNFEGGYIFEDIETNSEESFVSNQKIFLEDERFKGIIDSIVSEKRGLVLQSNLVESVFFGGFFSALNKMDIDIDRIYTSSWGFLIAFIFLVSGDQDEFEKNFLKTFSEQRINSFLDITFPNEYVFKNDRIQKYARDISKSRRLESYKTLLSTVAEDVKDKESRIFSTGFFSEILSTSFLLHPIFESLNIAGNTYNSGFPNRNIRTEDLLRTDVDEIVYVSVKNREKLELGTNKILEFYRRYIDSINLIRNDEESNVTADKSICIETSEKEYNLKNILKVSEKITEDILLSNNIFGINGSD